MSGTEGPGCVSRETAVERRATTRRAAAVVALGIDDKIELNGRMCRTLEGIARAIFQAWFVDFAPVRAKAAGAKRFRGMPQAVFDTLPTQFVNSPLRPIPRGWAVQVLDEIADFLNGLALQKFPPHDGRSLPVIKIAQLRAGHIAGADQAGVDIDPAYVGGDGDVLFSWSGSLECSLWAGGQWVVAFRNDVSTSGGTWRDSFATSQRPRFSCGKHGKRREREPHQSLGNRTLPDAQTGSPEGIPLKRLGRVNCRRFLGGLLRHYYRAAA